MNPLKCVFGVSIRKFLGFLVHSRGIDVDPAKVVIIATMKSFLSFNKHKELSLPVLSQTTSGHLLYLLDLQ